MASEPLTCPRCATSHPLDERFCPDCGMPLVYSGSEGLDGPSTDRQEWARKIKPQFAEGDLVRVAGGRNQAEAEFIQGLLLEEGVPSLLRRTRGFDVPDFLAAGPRDVLVPASGAPTARDVLLEAEIEPSPLGVDGAGTPPVRLMLAILGGMAVLALIIWLGTELVG